MQVQRATAADIPTWLNLASEVEFLFDPMIHDPSFHAFLQRNMERGSALCVRQNDQPPGAPLLGALAFSSHPPHYRIGWLAVAARWRRQGVGQLLVAHVVHRIQPPAELSVITFGDAIPAGAPARRFYQRMGFHAAEPAPNGPEGGTRQVFRCVIS